MSRSFGGDCHNKEQWVKREKWVYARQVASIGVTSLLINAFEPGEDGSFGGSLIISQDGKIIAETEIEQPSTLIYELEASYNSG
jgi:predicted amidohydrolase